MKKDGSRLTIDVRKFHDITRCITPLMQVYVNDPKPRFDQYYTLARNKVNLTKISIGSHTGTHIDAPKHFLPHGRGVDEEPLSKFIGQSIIIDVSHKRGANNSSGIGADYLDQFSSIISKDDILLLYTGTGNKRKTFAYLELSAAKWILKNRIKSVGIDTLSIEKYGSKEAPVHKLLLSNNVGIIENLDRLRKFIKKRMFLACLPLSLRGLDGSPARAVLYEIIK